MVVSSLTLVLAFLGGIVSCRAGEGKERESAGAELRASAAV